MTITLIAFAAGFRLLRATLLPELQNFAPLMAMAVCGALVLPGSLAMLIPLAALIGSDILLDFFYGVTPFSPLEFLSYACYGFGVATGMILRRHSVKAIPTLGAVTGNSLLFYLVTNTGSWLAEPVYAKTAAGWWQALTVGVPGFPPTWTFFGYSLASDLLFTGVFLGAFFFVAHPRRAGAHLARA